MSKKMILLALVASLAFIIGACASGIPIDPAVKGKIGDPVAPSGRVLLPTELTPSQPLSVDLSKTPAAPGKIGDPVAPSGRVTLPGELTLAAPIGADLSKTPAAPGKIGDPVAPSGRVTPPGELAPSSLMK